MASSVGGEAILNQKNSIMNQLLMIIFIVFVVIVFLLITIWSILEDIKFEKQLNTFIEASNNKLP
jgi:uncharacterized membrane protein YqiK